LRCCARAASGHATAAPPRSVMNSRRLIASPEAEDIAASGKTLPRRAPACLRFQNGRHALLATQRASADQLYQHLDREAVRQHDRLGRTIGRGGEQFERAAVNAAIASSRVGS